MAHISATEQTVLRTKLTEIFILQGSEMKNGYILSPPSLFFFPYIISIKYNSRGLLAASVSKKKALQ
jgi:hypothetical protein